jgi:hypothetical protein
MAAAYGRKTIRDTTLVAIPAVSMPIAHSLKIGDLWHCVVTKRHILVAIFCPQHKVLCNDHAVSSAS